MRLQTPRGLFDLSDQWIGDAADFEGSGKVVFTVNDYFHAIVGPKDIQVAKGVIPFRAVRRDRRGGHKKDQPDYQIGTRSVRSPARFRPSAKMHYIVTSGS